MSAATLTKENIKLALAYRSEVWSILSRRDMVLEKELRALHPDLRAAAGSASHWPDFQVGFHSDTPIPTSSHLPTVSFAMGEGLKHVVHEGHAFLWII